MKKEIKIDGKKHTIKVRGSFAPPTRVVKSKKVYLRPKEQQNIKKERCYMMTYEQNMVIILKKHNFVFETQSVLEATVIGVLLREGFDNEKIMGATDLIITSYLKSHVELDLFRLTDFVIATHEVSQNMSASGLIDFYFENEHRLYDEDLIDELIKETKELL